MMIILKNISLKIVLLSLLMYFLLLLLTIKLSAAEDKPKKSLLFIAASAQEVITDALDLWNKNKQNHNCNNNEFK